MKWYRSRQGIVFGVCRGVADATGISVRYIRIAAVIAAFLTLGWTVAIYLVAAVLMPTKRPAGYEDGGFKENLDDLKDDTADFLKREYEEIRTAGRNIKQKMDESRDVRKERNRESGDSSEESPTA